MDLTSWTYRRRFDVEGVKGEVAIKYGLTAVESRLIVGGETLATDRTPTTGEEATRNHRLAATLPDGRAIEAEAGYINWWNVGAAVRIDGRLVHESHPGKTIAFPARLKKMTVDPGVDMSRFKQNRWAIGVDIALGLLFFVVAKLTDLTTAAIFGAFAGLALIVAQRFVKVNIIGGLALFGVVMLLISAGLAWAFQDDWMVKMRTSLVGGVSATLFLLDAGIDGRWLGQGLMRYLPYNDLRPARVSVAMGSMAAIMASANYAVATFASTDFWLVYTTFLDTFLAIGLAMGAINAARVKTG
ncbi:MAG: septation protein IspZ [Caulobacteraceae bacterium]|nr:septation protein IspZ [Caulobacteraceae bacterium]